MRKFIITLLLTTASIWGWCADVIITTKSEKLEVKILEVSSTEVRYKKISNLEGPTFVLGTDDINTILYENGEVQVIEHRAQPAKAPAQSAPQQGSYPTAPYQPNYGYAGGPGYGAQPYAGNGIVRDGSRYYYKGQQIRLQDFLYQTCPVAYNYWRRNFIMEAAGWGCLGSGVVLLVGGACLIDIDEGTSWGLMIPGAALICAGIPLGTVGHIRRTRRAPEIFNSSCAARYTDIRIDLQASKNGIGLAFCF